MIVNLPYSIPIGKKQDKFYVNLNQYRNAHYHILNSAKITFKELIADQVRRLPKLNVIKLCYIVFAPSKRLIDTNNICSIADKFFCDALVEAGKLEDDNYNFLIETRFTFGGVDKENPRVEVHIEETNPMKIIFGKEEILAALATYVSKTMGLQLSDTVAISLKAEDGTFEAIIDTPMPTPSSNKPTTYREANTDIRSAQTAAAPASVSGSRIAVKQALQQAAEEPAKEPAKAEMAKPSLLNTKPQSQPQSIMAPKAVAENPSPTPVDAATTEATVDALAGIEAGSEPVSDAEVTTPAQALADSPAEAAMSAATQEPEAKPQITTQPEAREEAAVQTNIGGTPSEMKPKGPSIFSFKNKTE